LRRIGLSILLLAIAPVLRPQSAAPAAPATAPVTDVTEPQPTIVVKQEVRNVIVDVVATDSHGNAVTSLNKSRFRVFENGVPQEISFFEKHTGAARPDAAHPTAQVAPVLPPNEYTNVELAGAGEPMVVLLLDGLNTMGPDLSYARAEIIDYLKQIPAGTHVAIFTLSDRLRFVQGFSQDPAVLKAVLAGQANVNEAGLSNMSKVSQASGNGQGNESEREVQRIAEIAAVRAELNHFTMPSTMEAKSQVPELRAEMTLEAMSELAQYLNNFPGRKSLIWFCGSVPWMNFQRNPVAVDNEDLIDFDLEVRKMTDLMIQGRVSIYPVDARGLVTPPIYRADQSPGLNSHSLVASNGGTGRTSGANLANAELRSQMQLGSEHGEMEMLAINTGGRAFVNSNDLSGAVRRVQSIGENYYTIAYSPTDKKYDGSYRKIEIKVDEGQGIRLEYRRGYNADDPSKVLAPDYATNADALRSAMTQGGPNTAAIAFVVRVKAAAQQPDPSNETDRIGDIPAALKGIPVVRYTFHWVVDLRKVQFNSLPDGSHQGEIDAELAAFDADGKVLNSIYSRLPLKLADAQFNGLEKTGLPMIQTIDLPTGLMDLRAGLIDASSGLTGATEFPLMVQK
jgi:VWFA-related protein